MDVNRIKSKAIEKNAAIISAERKNRQLLLPNTLIVNEANKTQWRIISHLGSGGFGDVYKVADEKYGKKTKKYYAMKTEMHSAKMHRLRLEQAILKELAEYDRTSKKKQHFCQLFDDGNTKNFSWIVMTLIGPSLDQIRKMLNKQFSATSVINMALQTLDAIHHMHDVGFIHRDLKPGNICVGIPPKDETTLFLLDFGISRRIYKSAKSRILRKERTKVPFFGTRKFCSRTCHLEKDQGRKDDIECFIYTVLDLFHHEKGIPWNKIIGDSKKILEKKNELFSDPKSVLNPMIPVQVCDIIEYIETLKFEDEVDYKLIENELIEAANERSLNLKEKLDWQGKLEDMLKIKILLKGRKLSREVMADIKRSGEEAKGEETMHRDRIQEKLRLRRIKERPHDDRTRTVSMSKETDNLNAKKPDSVISDKLITQESDRQARNFCGSGDQCSFRRLKRESLRNSMPSSSASRNRNEIS
ncbi:unnamed protein product [Caenorhabditis bovis]|uniref:non-specific serine/threonine protein kinase n=1 Tax=Caenorhabditis bovis TaxID=2654633 RepID=A0A8S1ES29_9PELO|nr:unnamed protein product [Caenorhabditis bovis]